MEIRIKVDRKPWIAHPELCHVENDIFVEGIYVEGNDESWTYWHKPSELTKDEFRKSAVAPRAMNQQQFLKKAKLGNSDIG